MSAQPGAPDMAGPPLRPQGGFQQPPRPQAPPGQPVAGPPRPFLPGGAVQPPPGPRGPPLQPQQRPSGPNSFAPQQPRPPQAQGVPYQGPPHQGPPQQGLPPQGASQGPPYQGPPLQPGQPLRHQGPPPPGQRPPPFEKQNSFPQRPPAPLLNPGSRQSSLASLGPPPDSPGAQIRRGPNMEPEGTPPAVVKNRSFSIAGPPGAVPGVPLHEEERRKSVSVIGGRPEEGVSRGPGLAFIKEGVQSFETKESPLNVGLTRLSKEDVTRGSRESVRSDSSDGKGGNAVERPESRLSGSRMTESIMGSLDVDERKVRKNADDDDDVVMQNNKHLNIQNGKPAIQENGKSPVPSIDRSPSLTKSDSSPEQKPGVMSGDNRPPSTMSNASKTPEPAPKAPTPVGQRPPSATPSRDTPDLKNGPQDIVNGRPVSRAGPKPTDLGTPIKSGTPDDGKKATPTRKAASAPRTRREGDNDSGVDESTQGNEQVNGSPGSPNKKSPSKIPGLKGQSAIIAGGKAGVVRSPSKSAAHTPNTPDSTTSNTSLEKKKVPMNKVQVGAAPSPNIKAVKSKIGSLENATHKPGGGNIRIENRKLDFNKATPRIAAKNDTYQPGGGDKKITQKKLQWNAKSKIGSLENATHKPGGGDKKIESVKLDFKDRAKPKVASTVNITHKPGGGDVKCTNTTDGKNDFVKWPLRRWRASSKHFPMHSLWQIENQKLEIKAQSKIGSLDNVKHKPGGGDVKIFDDKDYLKQVQGAGLTNASPPSESPVPSTQQPTDVNLNQQS